MDHRRFRVALVAGAVLAFGACAGGSGTTASPTAAATASAIATATAMPTDAPSPTPTEAPSESDPPAGALTAEQAADVALQTIDGGAVVSIDAGRERGRNVWEVVVRQPDGSGVELYIAADNGEIVDQDPSLIPPEARDSAPAITAQAAMATALAAVPGAVVEVDLGTERGRTVWEILVRATAGGGVEFYIDAADGSVLKQERA